MIYDPNRLMVDDQSRVSDVAHDLGVPEISVMVYLLYLWQWTLQNSPSGELGKLSDEELAEHSRWDPDQDCDLWAWAIKSDDSRKRFVIEADDGMLSLENPSRVNSYMFDVYSELSMQENRIILSIP